ncbi:MAG: patatin-like phospholipase family protein [candidate division KSB1 bacterium]|nr:patatin-like phospholipase family protein [candidate division KSB1 bacterium]
MGQQSPLGKHARARLRALLTVAALALRSSGAPAAAQPVYSLPTVSLGDTVLGVYCKGLQLERPLRPKVGVALSGGGVRGLAQIGILKCLLESGLPVDVVAGASMGSIVGGLLASGLDPDELWDLARQIQWSEILQDRPPRTQLFLGQKLERERHIIQFRLEESSLRPDIPLALSPGQRLTLTLVALALRSPFGCLQSFDQYPVRLRILATDLIGGQPVVLSSGDLAEAMRASSSIPLLFSPVDWNGTMLVDGGLVDNIPVDETRKAGADMVIAIDTTSPLRGPQELDLPWEMADQVTTIMQLRRNEEQLKKADVAIRVPFRDQTALEFRNLEGIYQSGCDLGLAYVDEVRQRYRSLEDSLIRQHWSLRPDSTLRVRVVLCHPGDLQRLGADLVGDPCVRRIYHTLANLVDSGYVSASFQLVGDTLRLDAQPGPIVARIRWTGDPGLDSLLGPLRERWEGKTLSYPRFRQLVAATLRALREQDLALARVDTAIYDALSGELVLHVHPGRIADVHIVGTRRTRDFVLLREFPLHQGEYFRLHHALEGLANVYSTGLFEWVGLSVLEGKNGYKVALRVKERSPRLLRFGARYDLERRGKAFAEYADENLAGAGNPFTITGIYGVRDQALHASYRVDRLFRSYLTSEFRAYWETGRHFTYARGLRAGEYRRNQSGLAFSFGQQMRRLGTVWLSVRWQNTDLDRISGSGYPTGSYDLRTIGLRSVVDTRDHIPFARTGKRHEWFYEYSSGVFLTSEVSYTKLASVMESFFTRGRHTLHPRLAWGVSDLTTPFPEQYVLGGLDSFFGLREEELRGRHFLEASFEYRFALPWGVGADWYCGVRLDWGAAWETNTGVRSRDLFYGLGGYLAADTPLGPFTVAYGRTQRGESTWYLSLGRAF